MGTLVFNIIAIAFISCSYANPLEFDSEFDNDLGRIANGNNAAENQFRYAISLQYLSPSEQMLDTRGHRCGGALVTLRHALTSATCLHETVNSVTTMLAPHEHRVFAGSVRLNNDTSIDRIRSISNFTIHPDYIGAPAFVNDIGIIILMTPFTAATVTPLGLPAANFNPADFSLCQVAGWGGTNMTQTGNRDLQYANKYIYNQNLCSILNNIQHGTANILPTMVCAASFDILSSGCVNDDGNALVCGGTLTGILFRHDNCQSSSHPELYTRVSNYSAWIRSVSASPALFTPTVFIMAVIFSITQLFLNKN